VTSAGTLEAVDTVEVSSQLSGQIAALMADHNSIVRAGDPLAALDTATYEVLVRQAEAALAVAQAQHREAAAAVEGAQAHHDEALRDFEVKTGLAKSGGGAQRDAERSQAVARVQASELSAAAAREQLSTANVAAARPLSNALVSICNGLLSDHRSTALLFGAAWNSAKLSLRAFRHPHCSQSRATYPTCV
jgi:HlyD family secretion protein